MEHKVKSFKTEQFRKLLNKLSKDLQNQATEAFNDWKENPSKVGFKPLAITNGEVWSAQVNPRYRALAKKIKTEDGKNGFVWFWVGSHEDYNNILKRLNEIHTNIDIVRKKQQTTTNKNSHQIK